MNEQMKNDWINAWITWMETSTERLLGGLDE